MTYQMDIGIMVILPSVIISTVAIIESTLIFNNTPEAYARAFIIGTLIFLGLKITKNIIHGQLRKITKRIPGRYDDFLVDLLGRISPALYLFTAIYFPLKSLNIDPNLSKYIYWVFTGVITWEAIRLASLIVQYFTDSFIEQNKISDKKGDLSVIHLVQMLANIAIWVIAALLLLSNIGFDVTTLVASLGVGGIAIALAAQNILGDLFSSLSLFFDKPFQVGDFITSGTDMGTVERIGLKTTRLKTLQGEQLIIPNSDLTKARIQNFHRMNNRRITTELSVAIDTPTAKVEKIADMIEKIVKSQDPIEFNRCHFKGYLQGAILFELVYTVQSSDYDVFVKIQHAINIEIKKVFEKNHIEFAQPVQLVYLKK